MAANIVDQARKALEVAKKRAKTTAESVAANNVEAIEAMNIARTTNASLNTVRIFAEKGTPSSAALDAAVKAAAQTVNGAEVNAANVAAKGSDQKQTAADQVAATKKTLLAVLQTQQHYEQMLANQETQHKRQLAEQETQYKHQLTELKQVIADLAAADIAKAEKQRQDEIDTAAAALAAEIAELSK